MKARVWFVVDSLEQLAACRNLAATLQIEMDFDLVNEPREDKPLALGDLGKILDKHRDCLPYLKKALANGGMMRHDLVNGLAEKRRLPVRHAGTIVKSWLKRGVVVERE